jgi:ankyrin repeat protein
MFYQKFVLFSFPTFRNSISSPSGGTALMYSAGHGHLEVCKLLVSSKCDVNSSNQEYAHTPNLLLKCFYQKFVLFSFPTFRNSISSPSGYTALMWSADDGHLEVCKLLVSSKCDVNSSSQWYAHTPNLLLKCFYQKFVLFSFPTFRNSISSPSGRTALMDSAHNGHLEVCELLVSSKCDVNSSSQMYAHTPNLLLKCFTKKLFCFHFQLFVTPSLLPAVALH